MLATASACSTGGRDPRRRRGTAARSLADIARATGYSRSTDPSPPPGHGGARPPRLQSAPAAITWGRASFSLATAVAARSSPLRDIAHPALAGSAKSTGESAQLYVASLDEPRLRRRRRITQRAADDRRCGRRAPAHERGRPASSSWRGRHPTRPCAISGRKALTAATATAEQARPPDRSPAAGGMGRERWRARRRRGIGQCARSSGHTMRSSRCSISGPISRLRRADAKRYAPAVMAAARDIERALGYQA